MTQWVKNCHGVCEDVTFCEDEVLASLSGLKIQCCHELQCRSQMQLRSGIAVALASAGSCSSDLTPSLRTSICHDAALKKRIKKRGGGYRICQSFLLPL